MFYYLLLGIYKNYGIMEEKIFKQDAKQIVDLAFDQKLFKDEITRDDMNAFEELINFLLSSRYESYKRAEKLFESLKKTKAK